MEDGVIRYLDAEVLVITANMKSDVLCESIRTNILTNLAGYSLSCATRNNDIFRDNDLFQFIFVQPTILNFG